ncbi:MAG: tetratricopeptide repeat protein [Planctomycetia bacterium]|nr:tetratricopeptide repeat protein [Planctomycetia bacterium]
MDSPAVNSPPPAATPHRPPWPLRLGAIATVLVATMAVYLQVHRFEWLEWDDELHITKNLRLLPVTWAHIGRFWTEPFAAMYIPLSYMLFSAEAYASRLLTGGGPMDTPSSTLFHLVSLTLHLACALLVWRLLERLVGNAWGAAAGALLFALHPVQVESVAWVSEQRGLLSAFFSLLAIGWYLSFTEESRSGLMRGLCYAAGWVAFALALLSKPSASGVILILFALDVWYLRRPLWRVAAALIPWALPVIAIAVIARMLQHDGTLNEPTWLWHRPWVASDALAFYASKLFAPWNLCTAYGRRPSVVLATRWPYVAAAIVVAVLLVVVLVPKLRALRAPVAMFVAALSPILGFIPFEYQNISTVADRYMYLAMLGPALGVALLVARGPRIVALPIAACVLSGLAVLSYQQTTTWHDSVSLYLQAVRVNPDSSIINYSLGNVYETQQKYDLALHYYLAALKIKPNYIEANNNIANLYVRRGATDAAIFHYQKALAVNPDFSGARNNLAVVLRTRGQHDLAIQQFEEAIRLDRENVDALSNLGSSWMQLKRFDKAIPYLEEVVRLKPNHVDAQINLGICLAQLHRYAEAADRLRTVLTLVPGNAKVQEMLRQVEDLQRNGK